jgi:uncharacterized membrane protein YraQ (UPF0718 family)
LEPLGRSPVHGRPDATDPGPTALDPDPVAREGGQTRQLTTEPADRGAGPERAQPRRTEPKRLPTLEALAAGLLIVFVARWQLSLLLAAPAVAAWSTIFVAIVLQALPFLVMGVVLSGAIAAFVPASWLSASLPRRTGLAVPVAGLAGVALPGCECSAVPIAGRLVARGVKPAAALTFLLAAPAVNPIVLVATLVAFPGRPQIALARFLASLAAAIIVGLLWQRVGADHLLDRARRRVVDGGSPWRTFVATAQHDFLHAGGFLVVGGLTAATLQVAVPRSVLDAFAGNEILAIAALAVLAVILAICSEADAFVAASMSQFSLTARLVFLVVGPVADIKLITLQAGTFGRAFALRFAPLTLGVAVLCALVVGRLLL